MSTFSELSVSAQADTSYEKVSNKSQHINIDIVMNQGRLRLQEQVM